MKFSRVRHIAGVPFEYAEAGAEALASQVGKLLRLPVPEVEIVRFEQRVCCLSWNFLEPGRQLREGVDLLGASREDRRTSIDEARDILAKYLGQEEGTRHIIHLACFDMLIGNADRHQANWGVLTPARPGGAYLMAPFYDNGSAFGSNLHPEKVRAYLKGDGGPNRFDKGFKYELTVVGSRPARLKELLHKLLEWDAQLAGFTERLGNLREGAVTRMLDSIDPEAMSPDRKAFARQLLIRRSDWIREEVAKRAS